MLNNDANQPPPPEPYNLFTTHPVLADAVKREAGGADLEELAGFGARVGSAEVYEWGFLADRHSPELVTHDRFGDRIDEVHHHPAYHSLPGDGGYVARNARMSLSAQVEVGHHRPTSMTGAVLHALRHQPDIAEVWEPRIRTRSYDPRPIDPANKAGCLLGMGMTERQGGSDVRASTSTATPVDGGGPGGEYRLAGHKWFTSAPMPADRGPGGAHR